MAKQKKTSVAPLARDAPEQASPWYSSPISLWTAFAFAVLIFYWTPLFDDQATIQWDAVDVHYSAQHYFEQSLRHGGLPQWTPFEFSGFPFLADPQTAAWYPLHWPFFLAGITPRSIEWELALHAFLAFGGMFLLARRLLDDTGCAVLAGVFYAGSGFFVGHSSHVGMFETAALAPWLLWAGDRALESGKLSAMALTGLIGGLVVLAGHFQTTLYTFCALALFTVARIAPSFLRLWRRAAGLLVVTAAVAFALGAIQILPAFELTENSVRAGANYHDYTNGALAPGALATLISPDHYGLISNAYKGPVDITQFYFYGGFLLIPLAAVAFARWKTLAIPAALVLPGIWYALGPHTGLYSILTYLPGFRSVRAPVHVWFVVALGLSLAAATGAAWLKARLRLQWLAVALALITLGDVWYWNMSINPLAYQRASWEESHGNAFERFQSQLSVAKAHPPYRIWAHEPTYVFGGLNSSLDGRTEVTYGYNPLALTRYDGYLRAADANPKLRNGLAATNLIDLNQGTMTLNVDALPRISAPPHVTFVGSPAAARSALESLDPSQNAVVESAARNLSSGGVQVNILNYEDSLYKIRYSAPAESLIRIAVPFFPGWMAAIDGRQAEVLATDYALSGVIVPAGDHELTFWYHSTWFRTGAAISILGLVACLGLLSSSVFRKFSR